MQKNKNIDTLFSQYGSLYTDQSLSLDKTINISQDGTIIINYGGSKTLHYEPNITITLNGESIIPKITAKKSQYMQAIFPVNMSSVLTLAISHNYNSSTGGYGQYGITVDLIY